MVDPKAVMLGREFILKVAENMGLDASKIRGIQIEAWADDVTMVKVWYFAEKPIGELDWKSLTTAPAESSYWTQYDSSDQERRRRKAGPTKHYRR